MAAKPAQQVVTKQESSQAPASAEIRMLSLRAGDVKLPDGRVIKLNDVFDVTVETAEWLEKTFGRLFKRV